MTQETTATLGAAKDAATPESSPASDPVPTGFSGAAIPDAPPPAASDWPSDWRERLAGDDRRALDQLKRHGSPADLWKKARSLEQMLSSGEFRRDLPKYATDEERAEWQRERGIPDTPQGYSIELPDGLVLGEADKPVVDAFTAAVHEKGWDNAKVNEALGWYYAEQERQLAARAEADNTFRQKAETELRADLGPDYAPSLNAVKSLLATMPEGTTDNLLAGRLADGRRIGDAPGIVKWLAQISRELNPMATLVPAGAGPGGRRAADRIGEIEKLMGDRTSDYWRGPQAEPMQQEYRDLVEARDRKR